MVLLGHFQEVTSVCWCPADFTKIATCSDENTLKIWRLHRGLEEKPGGDKLSIVGWASQKKKETRAGIATVTSNQSTPVKAPRVKSSPQLVLPAVLETSLCLPILPRSLSKPLLPRPDLPSAEEALSPCLPSHFRPSGCLLENG